MEVNSASNLNLCFMGGMRSLIDVIIMHESNKVRKAACRVFNLVTSNNQAVQNFAMQAGAVNFAGQFDRE